MTAQELRAVAFPKLTAAQLAVFDQCAGAPRKRYQDKQVLVHAGERDYKFFVIKSGFADILDDADPPKTLGTVESGQFTGGEGHLTGAISLVTVVSRGVCEAYEVSAQGVREVVNRFPEVGDIILQAFIARRQLLQEMPDFTGVRVIGSRYSADTHRVREFLTKNRIPFAWLDLETDQNVRQLLQRFGVRKEDTPVVAWGRHLLLRNPSNRELAEAIGIRRPVEQAVYDLAIVGAGPAGLAAAVYGASEGLKTSVLERAAAGGQAASSMRIENYLGFPTGVTGNELAERAVVQARKFGAQLSVATAVTALNFDSKYAVLSLDDGQAITAKCLLVATGADYRRLDAEGCRQYEGAGVYYAATMNEAPLCRNATVVVVGGGNSAGQAAVFLAGVAREVYLVVRHDDLSKDMSSYLAARIEQTPNIRVLRNTTVRRITGDGRMHSVEVMNTKTGEVCSINTPALFSFIGAEPRSDWLPPEIERDSHKFVCTGMALKHSENWKAQRQPFLLETSRPGVFAAGDVRSGSVKRVASAVGEGSMAVKFVHEYLKGM